MRNIGEAAGRESSEGSDLVAEKEILSMKELAELLGCSPAHARRLLNGKVPDVPRISHMRGGRVRLIRRVVVLAWLETLKQVTGHG